MYWEYGRNDSKYYHYPEGRDRSPNLAVRQGKWKLLVNYDGSDVQLYDMLNDPKEVNNVAVQHPGLTAKLKGQVIRWKANLPKLNPYN